MGRWLILAVLAGITIVVPSAAGAAETAGPRSVDQIAAALSDDPVQVDPALGTGDTAGVHDVLTELVGGLDVPAYVVLTSLPPELRTAEDPAQQAAALLNATLGDGLYHVQFTDGIGWTGGFGVARELDTSPGQRANTRAREIGPLEYNQTTAALEAELVLRSAADPEREISDDQLREWIDTPRAFVPTEFGDRTDLLAQRWVVAIAAAVAVLIAGLILVPVAARYPLRSDPARDRSTGPNGRTKPVLEADPAAVSRAQRRYDKLRANDLASPHATAAAEALEAADLVAVTGDRLDDVGAWVLALQADRELRRIRRTTLSPYRPCVVNPLHGEASQTVRLSGSSIDAPACSSCSVDRGDFLTDSTWLGHRPYLDGSSVWARTGFGALVDDLARQVIGDRRGR
ncbi:MAG: hypothetical protein ABW075_03940 [Aeromicrobium sp.]